MVRQTVVPLGLKIDKYGNGTVTGPRQFGVVNALVGGQTETPDADDAVTEWFAPANYFEMSDAEKLKAPSFEPLQSGVRMGGGDAIAGGAFEAVTDFEEIVIDPELNQYLGRTRRKAPTRRATPRRRNAPQPRPDDPLFKPGLSIDPAARTRPAPAFQFREPTFEVAEATGELAAGRMTRSATVARAMRRRRGKPA